MLGQVRTKNLTQAKAVAFSEKIQIVSANVNGYRTRENEIRNYLRNKGNKCVLALSDTRLKGETLVRDLEGYTMIRNDRIYKDTMATAGGVALIVPKEWTCTRVQLKTTGEDFEAIAAIIIPSHSNSPPIKVLCIYNHPNAHFPPGIFTEFKDIRFNGSAVGGLLVGDLNCPHPSFGSRTTNDFGSRLLNLLNQENLIYFDIQSPTYYSNSTGEANTLDMVIGEPASNHLVESCFVDGDIGSDHLPIVTVLTNSIRTEAVAREKTNMTRWVKVVDKLLSGYKISDSIEESIHDINEVITEAKQKCTRTVARRHVKLPDDIKQNIKLRKTLMKNRKGE